MDLSTQMKSTVSKKLRVRIATLKKQKAAADKLFAAEYKRWQLDMAAWLKTEGAKRIMLMSPHGPKTYGSPVHDSLFWSDAPKRPSKSDIEKKIQECQRMLRQLGITGQATVKIGPSEVDKFFGVPDADDDE
jgi:hypothetical protein